MGVASSTRVNREIYMRYGEDETFNPYRMSYDTVDGFLLDLRNTAVVFDQWEN